MTIIFLWSQHTTLATFHTMIGKKCNNKATKNNYASVKFNADTNQQLTWLVAGCRRATEAVSALALRSCEAEAQHEASFPSLRHHLNQLGVDMQCVSDIRVTPMYQYPVSYTHLTLPTNREV